MYNALHVWKLIGKSTCLAQEIKHEVNENTNIIKIRMGET